MNYPPITGVHLNLTHRCNLACRYCYVSQEALDMPFQVAKDSADFLARNSIISGVNPSICFFGGEPLLRYDDIIVPLVAYINKTHPNRNFKFTITTNGTLLTDDKIEFFKLHNFGILTSIDGCAETQNYNRPFHGGGESLPVIEPHIKSLLSKGFSPTFRSTVIPATCQFTYKNYLYAIELGYKSFFAITNAFEDWDSEHQEIFEQEMIKIANHYIDYWKVNKKAPMRLSMLEKVIIVQLKNAKTATPQRADSSAQAHCGLGQRAHAAISPAGDIYGCQEMTSNEGSESIFYIGNIYDGTDDKLRERLADLYNATPNRGYTDCNLCEANIFCNGGCVANNYLISGKLNVAPIGRCFYQKVLNRTALRIIEGLRDTPEFAQSFTKTVKRPTKNNASIKPPMNGCSVCNSCQVCDVCQIKDN